MTKKHTYILGTGCSHDGSACLLKDGRICVAIEKERLTRRKHDGFNDTAAIEYCLDAEGITMDDVAFVVQNAACIEPTNEYFQGPRIFARYPNVPVYSISHHLSHAYSTIGTCRFKGDFNIIVIDGSGSSYDQCIDLVEGSTPDVVASSVPHLYFEKESYYSYMGGKLTTLFKDFSEFGLLLKHSDKYSYNLHSIGGIYEMFSKYCFGNIEDTGKLMGLAPYGTPDVFSAPLFDLRDGRFFINYENVDAMRNPARSYDKFKKTFQYYADIALWVQKETEKAIQYVFRSRLEQSYSENICYAGGVALNAVANAKILDTLSIKNLYMQPAAGDNGISIGCAFYGWLEILKRERVFHDSSTFFGRRYTDEQISGTLSKFRICNTAEMRPRIDDFFNELSNHSTDTSLSGALFQINIEDVGTYQLEFKGERLSVHHEAKFDPTSHLKIDGQSFYEGIQDRDLFDVLTKSNKLEVSNPAEVTSIFKSLDFENIFRMINTGDSNGQSELFSQPITYRRSGNRAADIARLLADGKVIALFQGGAEFGPRALGNRSILADPRVEGVRDFINLRIKLREDFRPFAPAVLKEDLLVYFKKDWESPYMILINEVRDSWKEQLKSVIHEDNSSRVQTVDRGWNRGFYDILIEFKELTGESILLNTSFNKKGMPIVETPQEALQFFVYSKLDCLVMEDYIIEKADAPSRN